MDGVNECGENGCVGGPVYNTALMRLGVPWGVTPGDNIP